MSILSTSFMIRGEELLMKGLAYRLKPGIYPVIAPYGVLTFGFVENVNEAYLGVSSTVTSWFASLAVVSTSWTASYTPVPSTSWTLSF